MENGIRFDNDIIRRRSVHDVSSTVRVTNRSKLNRNVLIHLVNRTTKDCN